MMSSNAASSTSPPPLEMADSSNMGENTMKEMSSSMPDAGGHMMAADDPDNPQNWPLSKKVYASAVSFAFSWAV